MKKQSIFEKVLRILPLVLFFRNLDGNVLLCCLECCRSRGSFGEPAGAFPAVRRDMDPVSSVFWNLDAWISAKNKGCCPSEIRSRGIF